MKSVSDIPTSSFQSGYREGLTEGSESEDALQRSFDAGYTASFDPFKSLGAIRGSLVVALLSTDQSESVGQDLKRLLEDANKIHCKMVDALKKESTVENVQALVESFRLEDFALTVEKAIEKTTQVANKNES